MGVLVEFIFLALNEDFPCTWRDLIPLPFEISNELDEIKGRTHETLNYEFV